MPELDLPPPFRAIALREAGNAFAHAIAIADAEGAGTLVHVGRFDLAEFALVLEPEETLRTVRRVFYAGMSALADALAAHAPPEKPISFEWPDAILVNGGLVGGGRLAWPAAAAGDEIPSWLVFGAMIRVTMGDEVAGDHAVGTALEEEGFDDLGSGRLVESFARHFMVALDAWHEQGFGEIAKNYLARLSPEKGLRRDIAENGDLVLRLGSSKPQRRSLASALARPSWLDPSTSAPRRQLITPPR
jgi:biotin-(acetyl-CoA carboxylase) ligase